MISWKMVTGSPEATWEIEFQQKGFEVKEGGIQVAYIP